MNETNFQIAALMKCSSEECQNEDLKLYFDVYATYSGNSNVKLKMTHDACKNTIFEGEEDYLCLESLDGI